MGRQPIQPQQTQTPGKNQPQQTQNFSQKPNTDPYTNTTNFILSPLLLSQQRITTVAITAKNHHSFLKPKAPFGPVSFPTSSPGNPYIENQNPCICPINQTLQTHTQQPIHSTLRPRFLPNLFTRQPIHRKPKPLHFSHKPNTANPYTATHTTVPFGPFSFPTSSSGNPYIENQNPCIFPINQTLQTHTQQTHTHFSHAMLFSQKLGLLCFFHRNQTKQFVWFL